LDESLGWNILGFISCSSREYIPSTTRLEKQTSSGISAGETPPKVDKSLDILSNFLFILALIIHYTICCWAVYKLFLLLESFVTKLPPMSFGYNISVFFPPIIGSIMGVLVLGFDQSHIRGFRNLLVSLLLIAQVFIVLNSIVVLISLKFVLFLTFPSIIRVLIFGGGILLHCFVILILMIRVLSLLFEKFSFLRQYKPELNTHSLLIIFASSNFLVLFLYYHSVYNSGGTVKPTWVESLG